MMSSPPQPPLLLQFLFGDSAGVVAQSASPRLLRWSQAFDDWLAERQRTRSKSLYQLSLRFWRRLLQERRTLPWMLAAEDLDAHIAWLQAQGYAAGEIYKLLSVVTNFYRWCGERGVDPACGAGFNPAAGVRRPGKVHFLGTDGLPCRVLSREEVAALLGVLQLDRTPLGRREYAYCLARLSLGVTVEALNRLQWGQIRPCVDPGALPGASPVCVQWHPQSEPRLLPGDVWSALRDYLEASGRLAGMQAGSYLFVSLENTDRFPSLGDRAGDWVEGRPLSSMARFHCLKTYARAAGIDARKLTAGALRRTAIRLKMDAFPDGVENHLAEMRAFLDCRTGERLVKFKLRTLAGLPPDTGRSLEQAELEKRVPVRGAGRLLQGTEVKHGLYLKVQPQEPVAAILAENIQGMEAEIAGMRVLGEGLLSRLAEVGDRAQLARLAETYSLNAVRLGSLLRKEAERQELDPEAEQLAQIQNMCRELGYTGQWPPKFDPSGDSGLDREIAALRYVLHSVMKIALETGDVAEYVRMVGLYSTLCWRLGRLLKLDPAKHSLLKHFGTIADQAIKEVLADWGIGAPPAANG